MSARGRIVPTRTASLVDVETGQVAIDKTIFGPPDIQPSELSYCKKIGGGCFGNVYEGKCRGMKVAIKKLFKQDLSGGGLEEFKREVEVCSQLNHPNVLLFMGACTIPGEMAIVTEMCDRGNLEQLLHNKKAQLSLYRRMEMAKEAAVGMAWLHGGCVNKIVHRDLKPSNLLVDKYGQIKVCDFGLAAIKPANESLKDKETIPGTPLWMPPEVMMGRQVTEKADVYSYGIVLWEIVTQEVPFPDVKSFPEFRKAICLNHVRPPLKNITLPSIKALLEQLWHKDPTARPAFSEVVSTIEEILIECAIADVQGRKFWKQNFHGKSYATFDKFLGPFLDFAKLSQPTTTQLECFKLLAVSKYKDDIMQPFDVVKIGDFGKLLENFGPMVYTVEREGKKNKTITIFDRILQTCKQPWFHGDISTNEAVKLLQVHSPGYYLVRLSSSKSGCFTVSRVTRNKTISHHRIDYCGSQNFSTHSPKDKKETIKGKNISLRSFLGTLKDDMYLVNACPGSQFRVLFKAAVAVTNADDDGYGLGEGTYIED